jgi:hypothetical protein
MGIRDKPIAPGSPRLHEMPRRDEEPSPFTDVQALQKR